MRKLLLSSAAVLAVILVTGTARAAESGAPQTSCPAFGWSEGLKRFLQPDAPFPTNDTQDPNPSDCAFQQWSEEAFVWATALNSSGVPRFMTFQTPAEFKLCPTCLAEPRRPKLRLASRAVVHPAGIAGAASAEGAGAIVEADGNMLVAHNGYPVYASVHMTQGYFNTAQANLVATGGYQSQDSYFNEGDAVFKATWLRLADNEAPPPGAFVTEADVPVLKKEQRMGGYTVLPDGQKYVTAKVALVGLHVVGYTANHPEFLWATFEHHTNTPRTPDNSFCTVKSQTCTVTSDPNSYTFYTANTQFSTVNLPNPPTPPITPPLPPQLKFDAATQRFTPANNAVLENKTGGATFGANPQADIANVSSQTSGFLKGQGGGEAAFASYDLIGTVWMPPNFYVAGNPNALTANQTNAVGSLNLANSTAETFEQVANVQPAAGIQNCFMCHNATTLPQQQFKARRIAISHVLEFGTQWAVPNLLNVPEALPPHK